MFPNLSLNLSFLILSIITTYVPFFLWLLSGRYFKLSHKSYFPIKFVWNLIILKPNPICVTGKEIII